MDADDPERRQRLADLVADLRSRCINLGLPAKHVNQLRAHALLALYDRELRRQGLHRDQLDRIMREPPKGQAA